MLLQLASQDALARLPITELGVDKASFTYAFETYFDVQKHTSLAGLVKHYIHKPDVAKLECLHSEKGTLIQVSKHSHVRVYLCLGLSVFLIFAQWFCTDIHVTTFTLQVTTYGLLLSYVDIRAIAQEIKMGEHDLHLLMLQEFDTEMDFSRKVR